MGYKGWMDPDQHPGDWQEILVDLGGLLTDGQVRQASAAIGYALREELHGEDLSEPRKIKRIGAGEGLTTVRYRYDSTKARSDDPDTPAAFLLAESYVIGGSPVRKTNRAGEGTMGTRLVQGIGPRHVRFWVR